MTASLLSASMCHDLSYYLFPTKTVCKSDVFERLGNTCAPGNLTGLMESVLQEGWSARFSD
ncbi:MAG: hypothetical protein GX456_17570 [Verrucomicrobia bacterium]|nr:hypothetical protein [Verrucomicrobiota bacterium]